MVDDSENNNSYHLLNAYCWPCTENFTYVLSRTLMGVVVCMHVTDLGMGSRRSSKKI